MIAVNQNPRTLMEAMRHFDIETAEKFIAGIKWPEGPCCPKCGSINVGAIPSRRRFQCREKGCRRQFSLTTNTILEATHLRADQWVIAIWLIVNSKNGSARARWPARSGANSNRLGTFSTASAMSSPPSIPSNYGALWRAMKRSWVGSRSS